MQLKLPQCPICMQDYNLKERKPLYICPNIHTICKQCFTRLPRYILCQTVCPLCKQQLNDHCRQNSDIICLIEWVTEYLRVQEFQKAKRQAQQTKPKAIQLYLSVQDKFRMPKFAWFIIISVGLFSVHFLYRVLRYYSRKFITHKPTFLSNIIPLIVDFFTEAMNLYYSWSMIIGQYRWICYLVLVCIVACIMVSPLAKIVLFQIWGIDQVTSILELKEMEMPNNWISKSVFIMLLKRTSILEQKRSEVIQMPLILTKSK